MPDYSAGVISLHPAIHDHKLFRQGKTHSAPTRPSRKAKKKACPFIGTDILLGVGCEEARRGASEAGIEV